MNLLKNEACCDCRVVVFVHPRQNGLVVLRELGRIEQTLFLLSGRSPKLGEYLLTVDRQQREIVPAEERHAGAT
jgi:hypothetical protein